MTLRKFQKKTKNGNSEQSHSAKKSPQGTLWDFLNIRSLAKHQKIERKNPLGTLKNCQKSLRGTQSRKGGKSHSAEKSGSLLLRNACEKISAYAPVRTPTFWVEKQASYH